MFSLKFVKSVINIIEHFFGSKKVSVHILLYKFHKYAHLRYAYDGLDRLFRRVSIILKCDVIFYVIYIVKQCFVSGFGHSSAVILL